jgi:hypothetical protein
MATLRCGSPASPYSAGGLLHAEQHEPEECVLRIACAYLSQTGLETLASQILAGHQAFQDYRSEWVIGIDHGISEPRALETILNWPPQSLRLFCPGGRLNAAALRGNLRLHAKVVALMNKHEQIVWVATSSANTTGAAMGPSARNYEIGVSYAAPSGADTEAFQGWWQEIH